MILGFFFIPSRSALRLQWFRTGLTKHFRKLRTFCLYLQHKDFGPSVILSLSPQPVAVFGVRDEHHQLLSHKAGTLGSGEMCLISAPVCGLRNQSPSLVQPLLPPWAGTDGFGIDLLPSLPRVSRGQSCDMEGTGKDTG